MNLFQVDINGLPYTANGESLIRKPDFSGLQTQLDRIGDLHRWESSIRMGNRNCVPVC